MIYFLTLLTFHFAVAQKTSQGVLAAVIESLSKQTSDFSSQASAAFSSLNTKLETEQNFTSLTSEFLIASKISELQSEYEKISENLGPLRASYELASKNCNEHLSCSSCKLSNSCVWCTVEALCVNGDKYGPLNGDCSDFLHQDCSYAGCEGYKTCSSCIGDSVCGWCNIGHMCYEGTGVLKGDCAFEYYYHSEGNTQCPDNMEVKEDFNDNAEEVILAEIRSLEAVLKEIQLEIKMLEEAKKDIVRKASLRIEVGQVEELGDYDGIVEGVDELAEKEGKEDGEWKKKLWSEWMEKVDVEMDEMVNDEFGEVIRGIQEYQKSEEDA